MKNRKYIGLEDARAEMPTHDRHNGLYIEVSYDLDNDEVLATPYVDFGMWIRTVYANRGLSASAILSGACPRRSSRSTSTRQ